MTDNGTLLASLEYLFNFRVILDNFGIYLRGLQLTIELLVGSLLIGLLIAVPLAVLRVSGPWPVRGLVWSFIYFFRGTPLLVQLFMIYYGLGQFPAVRESIAWPLLREAWFCALLAFALNTGAYTA